MIWKKEREAINFLQIKIKQYLDEPNRIYKRFLLEHLAESEDEASFKLKKELLESFIFNLELLEFDITSIFDNVLYNL